MFMVHFSPMLNIYSYNKGQCKVKLSHVGKYNFCILIAWPRMDHIAPALEMVKPNGIEIFSKHVAVDKVFSISHTFFFRTRS